MLAQSPITVNCGPTRDTVILILSRIILIAYSTARYECLTQNRDQLFNQQANFDEN